MDNITFPVNLQTTIGLSILLRGVISLPDATLNDKLNIIKCQTHFSFCYQINVGYQGWNNKQGIP